MMRVRTALFLMIFGLFAAGSSFLWVHLAWAETSPGEGTGSYVIRPGDTLWDIARGEWGDPFLWPKLWEANPYIKNPDLIYPDDVLAIPQNIPPNIPSPTPEPSSEPASAVPGVSVPVEAPPVEAGAAEGALPTSGESEHRPSPVVSAEPRSERVSRMSPETVAILPPASPSLPRASSPVSPHEIASGGSILEKVSPVGFVTGSEEEKTLLGTGDTLSIRLVSGARVAPDELYTLYRPVKQVRHPKTHRMMGTLIRTLGLLKILAVEKDKAMGEILQSYDFVTQDDGLAAYQPPPPFPSVLPVPGPLVAGTIVETSEGKTNAGQHDTVYLDKGARDGVGPGQSFSVFRDEEGIGELLILAVQPRSATALITRSRDTILPGDAFRPRTP
jgi:hypothetical protein